MRKLIHEAVISSRGVIDGVMEDISRGNTLTDDEQLKRYTAVHRGNARSMAQFVSQNAPPGTDRMQAWHAYETAMEKLLAERGGTMEMPGYLRFRKEPKK